MDAHTVAEAFERKLKERASLRSNSSGVLLIALGGAAAAECSLLAATARAHMAVGADGRRLQIVVMTDRAAHSRLSAPDSELARSLFDGVLPLPADALSAAHKLGAVGGHSIEHQTKNANKQDNRERTTANEQYNSER